MNLNKLCLINLFSCGTVYRTRVSRLDEHVSTQQTAKTNWDGGEIHNEHNVCTRMRKSGESEFFENCSRHMRAAPLPTSRDGNWIVRCGRSAIFSRFDFGELCRCSSSAKPEGGLRGGLYSRFQISVCGKRLRRNFNYFIDWALMTRDARPSSCEDWRIKISAEARDSIN